MSDVGVDLAGRRPDHSSGNISNTRIFAQWLTERKSPRPIGTLPWPTGSAGASTVMDSTMFGLVSPLVIKEFALDVPTYRSGLQIALLVGIAGLYFWPWL